MTKKKSNILLFTLAALLFFVSAILCINPTVSIKRVYALREITDETDLDQDFFMYSTSVVMDGEIAAGYTGMRFEGIVGKGLYDEVTADSTKSFGALIFPNDGFDYFNIDVTDGNYLQAIVEKQAPVMVFQNLVGTPVTKANGDIHYYFLKSSILTLQYGNIPRDFFGLMFIKTETANGTEYTYANPDGANVQNLAYTASVAYNSGKYTNEADLLVLKNFVEEAWYYQNGTSWNETSENIKNGTYLEKEMETAKTNLFLEANETYNLWADTRLTSGTATLKLYTDYSSSDSDVATVSNTGVVTAKSEGTATITVKCMDVERTVKVQVVASLTSATTVAEVSATNNVSAVDFSAGDSSITIKTSNDWTGQSTNGAIFKLTAPSKAGNTVSFKVTNNGTNPLYLKVVCSKASNQYLQDEEYTIASLKEGTGTIGSGGQKATANAGALLNAIANGESLETTITLNDTITDWYIKVLPQYSNNKFLSGETFTLSEFSYGSGVSYLTVTSDTQDCGVAIPDVTKTVAGEKIYLSYNVNEGYVFSNYKVVGATSGTEVAVTGNTFVMPEEGVNLSIVCTKQAYNVTVASGMNAEVKVAQRIWGEEVTVFSTDESKRVVGVTYRYNGETYTSENDYFIMPKANVEITAVTTISLYKLSIDTNVEQVVNFVLNGAYVSWATEGDVITVCHTEDNTIAIASITVTGAASVDGNTFVVGTSDVVLTAFTTATAYPVETNVQGEGTCEVTFSPETPAEGDTVTVTLTPAEGYTVETVTAATKTNSTSISLTKVENSNPVHYTYTQPADGVVITVTTTAIVTGEQISAYEDWDQSCYEVTSFTKNDTSITVKTTRNQYSGNRDNIHLQVGSNLVGKSVISVKVKNIGENPAMFAFGTVDDYTNHYPNNYSVKSVSHGEIDNNTLKYTSATIAVGDEIVFTITLNSPVVINNNKEPAIFIMPMVSGNNVNTTLVISDIIFS